MRHGGVHRHNHKTSRLLREALRVRRWLDTLIADPDPRPNAARLVLRWSKLTRAEIRKHLKEA